MSNIADLQIRAAAQIALLGVITDSIRAVSVDQDSSKNVIRLRVHYSAEPHETEQENMSAAATEISAAYPMGWTMDEEYIICAAPQKPDYLRLVVYAKCESPDFLPPA